MSCWVYTDNEDGDRDYASGRKSWLKIVEYQGVVNKGVFRDVSYETENRRITSVAGVI